MPSQATLAADTADGSYAALCFECHGGTKPSGFADKPVDIKQFAHRIRAARPAGTPSSRAAARCRSAHRCRASSATTHTVRKRGNTALITDERGASLSTTSAAGVREFCFTCHATSDTIAGWDSETATFTAVASADKVVGLPRDGGVLHLPAHEGHSQEDTASCYDCHGDELRLPAAQRAQPGDGTVRTRSPRAPSQCRTTSTVASGALDASAHRSTQSALVCDASASIDAHRERRRHRAAGVRSCPSCRATPAPRLGASRPT